MTVPLWSSLRGRVGDDRGSAMVEFCTLGTVLLVPLVYLLLSVFAVQSAAYAAAAATREAGRAFVSSDGDPAAAGQAARVALGDHGLQAHAQRLEQSCSHDPCLTPTGTVAFRLVVDVPLPLLPRFLGDGVGPTVRVEAEHVEYVDRFRAVDG